VILAPCPAILTTGRLDRAADPDRDLGSVAMASHHDVGMPADQATAKAREAFRAGEMVRGWSDRASAG